MWDGQIAKGEMDAYDYSEKAAEDDTDPDRVASQWVDASKLGQKNEKGIYEVQDIVQQQPDDGSEEEDAFDQGEPKKSTGLFSYLTSFTGARELTADTLDPVMSTIREHLVAQNVATEIADHLCQSVKSSLLGKKLGSFERKWKKKKKKKREVTDRDRSQAYRPRFATVWKQPSNGS